MMAVIVITPALMVINVILWQIRELHAKYYFFVANLLATDVAFIVKNVECLVSILYLLGLDAKPIASYYSHNTIYSHWCIGFHRSIMTTKNSYWYPGSIVGSSTYFDNNDHVSCFCL